MKLNWSQPQQTARGGCLISGALLGEPLLVDWDPGSLALQWSRCKNRLGSYRLGRVALHAMCMAQNPHKAGWYWRGMLREFTR